MTFHRSPTSFVYTLRTADFSNAVCSPPGSSKRSDPVGVVYWQVRIRTLPSRKPSHHFSFLFEGPRNADVSFIFSSTHDDRRLTPLSPEARTTLSRSTCGRSARRHGSWRMATHPSRTCRTRGLSSATNSRLCASRRPYHDPFTISCIYVLSLSLLDRTQTSCSTCVQAPPLFYFHFSHCLYFLRLILYGLHALARRLFGCWASVRQSTRSSYFARMMISIRKSKVFFFFLGHSFLPFIIYLYHRHL